MLIALFALDAGNDANCKLAGSSSAATTTTTTTTTTTPLTGLTASSIPVVAPVCMDAASVTVIKVVILIALAVLLVKICFNYMVYLAVSKNDHKRIKTYVKCMVCFFVIGLVMELMDLKMMKSKTPNTKAAGSKTGGSWSWVWTIITALL